VSGIRDFECGVVQVQGIIALQILLMFLFFCSFRYMIWLLTQCFKLLSFYIYTAFHPDTVLVGGNSRHCGEICRRSGGCAPLGSRAEPMVRGLWAKPPRR